MVGTLDHARRRSSTSPPSMSGSPRSRMIRSGCFSVTHFRASAPVSASCTTKPSSSRPARRKRRICTSSSTTRTTGDGSLIGIRLRLGRVFGQWKVERYGGSLIGALACGVDAAAIGGHERLRNPKSEPGTRCNKPNAACPRKNRSPRCESSSPVSPAPLSLTANVTSWPLRLAATLMVEPAGEYLAALSTTCTNACSTSTGST